MGKTAIVEGLAQRIVHQDVPDTLPRRLISLDMGALVGECLFVNCLTFGEERNVV